MPLNSRGSVIKAIALNFILTGSSYAFAPFQIQLHPTLDLSSSCRSSVLCLASKEHNMPKGRAIRRNKKQKLKFIRIVPRNSRGNRRIFELQTAVTTLYKTLPNGGTSIIDLHSQIHFGDGSYFDFYNSEEDFGSNYDKIFYELIVSENMLQTNPNGSRSLVCQGKSDCSTKGKGSSLNNPISPTLKDVNTAHAYDLDCQLNVIDYTQPNWIHCDTTREEYDTILQFTRRRKLQSEYGSGSFLWSLASTNILALAPLQGFMSVLFRPQTPSTVASGSSLVQQSSPPSQRLFSNLFLQGDSLATLFRILLWSFSPSPEVSILLLDWSSLVDPKPTGMISPVFIPVMESLMSGNIVEARRLIFAQMLVSGQTAGGRDATLVGKRNSLAVEKVMNSFNVTTKIKSDRLADGTRYALLYGAMHSPDLQSKFEKMGYTVSNVEWRTAWSISVPTIGSLIGTSTTTGERRVGNLSWGNFAIDSDPKDIVIGLLVVPLYLLIGGLDWMDTIQGVAQSLDGGNYLDIVFLCGFYLLRHAAMYLGLSKFVVEWDGDVKLFGRDD
mmetsp:Transcript_16751/g.31731  ORF Transcript_16751/g.31731 Transcript_16751/m.31731 type:complete len:555 (+) Transcript_16751:105-1769(+)